MEPSTITMIITTNMKMTSLHPIITSLGWTTGPQTLQRLYCALYLQEAGHRLGLKRNITMIRLSEEGQKLIRNWSQTLKTSSLIRTCQLFMWTLPQLLLKLRYDSPICPYWMLTTTFYSGLKSVRN